MVKLNPFNVIRNYIAMCPPACHEDEQLFVFADNSLVKPGHFRSVLKILLKKIGLDDNLYCIHSLRTGRTGDLLKYGLSVETIKKLGHWKSNAVFTYLRN